ncbi:hypothetical protein ACFXPX_09880 [Kitasatospora sp. NPDC059146]|uniref:hypothetical protein n=1 Tax=Kitasatospora sp. NPDC059146 TaxID=3346741 RepID=UPI00368274C2
MTDKFPRPGGGDGGGPAETATERLLREAMDARASLITVHGLRPAAPPRGRVRRLRPVYLTAVPVLALAASLGIGLLAFHGDPVAKQDVPPPPAASITAPPTPGPDATPTQDASPTPAGTAPTTGGPAADRPLSDLVPSSSGSGVPTGPGTPYTFRGVKLKVPAGWKAVPLSDQAVCLLSPGAPTDPQRNWSSAVCAPYGVQVTVYNSAGELQGGAWPTTADLDAPAGWAHQGSCPVWGNPHPPTAGEMNSAGPTKSAVTVAGSPAVRSQWQVTCGSDSFTTQLWALPKDQVFVSAQGLRSDYQPGLTAVVNSLDPSGHQAPAAAEPGPNDLAVSIDGLSSGQQMRIGSAVATFSVTFRNTGQGTYDQVQPLLFTDRYGGTPTAPGQQLPNDGKLEVQTDGGWSVRAMSRGSDTSYAVAQDQDVFSLGPGQSRRLTYRLTIGPKDGTGDMPLRAQALVPYRGSGDLTVLGHQDIALRIVQ